MSSTRRIALGAALAMALIGIALAQGGGIKAYPTVDRVEFVLECMQKNGGKQEFLYKCACVIDEIAQKYAYDDFVEASTAARYQSLAGERGGAASPSAAHLSGVVLDGAETLIIVRRSSRLRSTPARRAWLPFLTQRSPRLFAFWNSRRAVPCSARKSVLARGAFFPAR